MNWGSAGEFFAMGGKAGFVWGAYAVSLIVIAAEVWSLRRRRRTWLERASRRVTSNRVGK